MRGAVRLARQLRQTQTAAEQAMWALLRNRRLRGLKFRRQLPVESFVLDFCCYELRLAIEVDGEIHSTRRQADRDQNRGAYLASRGYLVLRFPNALVFDDPDAVLQRIAEAARGRGWVPP